MTGLDGQGDVAETVLGIGGVVVTVDEATRGLAANINVMATAATAPILRTLGIMAPTVIVRVAGSNVPALPITSTVFLAKPTCILSKWDQREFAAESPVGR